MRTSTGSTDQAVQDALGRAKGLGDKFANLAAAIDHPGAFPTVEFTLLHESGLLIAPLPWSLGGLGLAQTPGMNSKSARGSTGPLLRILEEVGRGNLSVGRLLEGHYNALLLIEQFGRPDQQEEWAADARLGRIFGVWNSQSANGVRFDSSGSIGPVRMSGTKTFASGAGVVTRPISTGLRPDNLLQMAVVPVDESAATPVVDSTWWQPLGMRASSSHLVDLTGVEIDAERCWLGEPGAYLREPWFTGGSIRFAAVQLGGVRGLVEATVASLREWGRADDPFQRARVGQMAIAVESGRQWLRSAAEVADRVGTNPDATTTALTITHAQMTRTALEAIGQDVLRLAEQSVGARGLIQPHPIERIGRDLTLYLRQPGPDSSLTQVGQAFLEGGPTGPFYPHGI